MNRTSRKQPMDANPEKAERWREDARAIAAALVRCTEHPLSEAESMAIVAAAAADCADALALEHSRRFTR
jgi:hypothetical protein